MSDNENSSPQRYCLLDAALKIALWEPFQMANNIQDNGGVATQQKHYRLFSQNIQNHIAENCCHWRYLHTQLVLCSWTTFILDGVERFPVEKKQNHNKTFLSVQNSFHRRKFSYDGMDYGNYDPRQDVEHRVWWSLEYGFPSGQTQMVWWCGISNTFRKSDYKKKGGGNHREREYAVFCFLRTSLDIQGQWIYVSVLSIPQWTVQPKTKNGTLQMRIPCSSVVVQHGKSSCCGHLCLLCHRVTAKIYRGIRSTMTNYLRMPQLEHRFPYCFEYIHMFRQM